LSVPWQGPLLTSSCAFNELTQLPPSAAIQLWINVQL
jgi:hypothetical protein